MNMDIGGRSAGRLRMADSNPGTITHAAGGVGRNIAHNLALLGKKSALISAVGDDLYGQDLLHQARAIGLDVSHCAIVKGGRSSTYLALLDEGGEMVSAINDMAILEHLSPEFIENLLPVLKSARALIVDCNLPQATLEFLMCQADLPPIFVDAVSTVKVMKIKDLLGRIHTFKPNRLEAEILTGMKLEAPQDAPKIAYWFHAQGLKNLSLSDSRFGLYYSQIEQFPKSVTRFSDKNCGQNKNLEHSPEPSEGKNALAGDAGWIAAPKTHIVSVSGAGDACVAGLVCGWLEGWSLAKSSHFAQSCAAITLGSDLTNAPNLTLSHALNQMEQLYEHISTHPLS